MCLAIPAKVVSITGTKAVAEVMGNTIFADISLLADVKVGDYVMVHAGYAIQKYLEKEAMENLALIEELVRKVSP
jgi:hydrogenase expression/formation protein HypC